jgi:hypothetical protein
MKAIMIAGVIPNKHKKSLHTKPRPGPGLHKVHYRFVSLIFYFILSKFCYN